MITIRWIAYIAYVMGYCDVTVAGPGLLSGNRKVEVALNALARGKTVNGFAGAMEYGGSGKHSVKGCLGGNSGAIWAREIDNRLGIELALPCAAGSSGFDYS